MSPSRPDTTAVIGYAPGVYDLFHVGHLNALLYAKSHCDYLIAGVVSDRMAQRRKGRTPIVPLADRMAIVGAISCVDQVVEEDTVTKAEMWEALRFHVLFKGDDWRGTPKGEALELLMQRCKVTVEYFPYTSRTSTTQLRQLVSAASPETTQTGLG